MIPSWPIWRDGRRFSLTLAPFFYRHSAGYISYIDAACTYAKTFSRIYPRYFVRIRVSEYRLAPRLQACSLHELLGEVSRRGGFHFGHGSLWEREPRAVRGR